MSNTIIYCQKHNGKDFNFNYFLYNIALFLEKNYNYEINLVHSEEFIKIKDIDTRVLDCQLAIYYNDVDVLKGICYADTDTPLSSIFYTRNNPNDLFLHAQNGSTQMFYCDNIQFGFEFINYLPENEFMDFDNYYNRRLYQKKLKDKLIFRGNYVNMPRNSVLFLKNNEYCNVGGHITDYFDTLTEYKVGLSIPGLGELCYRDVEYMAIGIPFIKVEYETKWDPELIPNYHYISIDRKDVPSFYTVKWDDGRFENLYSEHWLECERFGSEELSKLYINKFMEVKDNLEFLDFISTNARKYYNDNLHPLNRTQKIINLLKI